MRKGHGCIIHVSDFVEEDHRQLIIRNEAGIIVKDARCITYPGSGSDPWWDHVQLLAQVDQAMEIFEEAHPDCVALFVFDQSSAHASLGPDALCAFNMNKSNGGGQRKQKDTVVPMNNPCEKFHGKPQRMTTIAGEAKGLNVASGHHFSILSLSLNLHHLTNYLTYHLICAPNLVPHSWGARDHSHNPVTD